MLRSLAEILNNKYYLISELVPKKSEPKYETIFFEKHKPDFPAALSNQVVHKAQRDIQKD